jgi:hypothetical protein
MPDIASNKSYVGLRGYQHIGSTPLKLVYQLGLAIVSAIARLHASELALSARPGGAGCRAVFRTAAAA